MECRCTLFTHTMVCDGQKQTQLQRPIIVVNWRHHCVQQPKTAYAIYCIFPHVSQKNLGSFFNLQDGGRLICGYENLRSAVTIVVYVSWRSNQHDVKGSLVMIIVSKSKSRFKKKIVEDRNHNIFSMGTIFYNFSAFYEQRLNHIFSVHAICTAPDYFIIATRTLLLSAKNILSIM